VNVCVVGRGKVGRALVRGLRQGGIRCRLVAGHDGRPPRGTHTLLLAVPDGAIREVAERLAPTTDARVALHCAGARGADELAALRPRAAVAVFHPLVSFAPGARSALAGATFTYVGDSAALKAARLLAKALGARVVVRRKTLSLPEQAAYHAAAALVANGAAALAFDGARLLVQLGFGQAEAERALSGLLASVAQNVHDVGVPRALTGPVVRGDRGTVARHLTALADLDGAALATYSALQPVVVATARAAGLSAARARSILQTVRSAKGKTGA
jgi:predicted short-subunit dehydrogenase-like oxidoreductase (DUF2520 family)